MEVITNDDFEKEIWINDFYTKASILESKYDKTTLEDLYIALNGSLNNGCTLWIEDLPKRKVRKVKNYSEIKPYTDEYKKVLIYPKDFYIDSCIQMRFVDYLNAFVIDIDEVRHYNINIALEKIDSCPIKPNYIVHSGNGLHLYYIFKEKFEFYFYTKAMAKIRGVKRVEVRGREKKTYKVMTADKLKLIYAAMIEWFTAPCFKIDELHLAHGIRIFGGKTKNPNIRTTVFKCSEERFCMEDFAQFTSVELISQEEIPEYYKILESKDEMRNDHEEEPEVEVKSLPTLAPSIREKFNRDAWRAWLREYEIKYRQEMEAKRKEIVPRWDDYNHFVQEIKIKFKVGIRNYSLFALSSRAHLFHIPENVLKKDVLMLVECMNERNPEDIITTRNINAALDGYWAGRSFSNRTISNRTGYEFPKTQKQIRAENKSISEEEERMMLEAVEKEYSQNPKISLRDLSDALQCQGITRKKSFLGKDPEVAKIRDKYRGKKEEK